MIGHLGKKPVSKDERDITFAEVKAGAGIVLPHPPANFGHGFIFKDGEDPVRDWTMDGNGPDDTVYAGYQGAGDCVFACFSHITREANKIAGKTVKITGLETISDYSACTGYVLDDETTDLGTDMREGMKYWQKTGILDADGNRHKIGAYVSIDPSNLTELWEACYVFSAVAIGFEFQQAQADQFDSGTWDYDPNSYIVGGHAIPAFGRNAGRIGVVSWAKHLWFTQSAYTHLNDESWAMVLPDELRNGKTERGMDLSALNAALESLA